MPVNRDFRDLFAELNAAGAEYLLVGGYALAVHGLPRFTKHLDVWVNPTSAIAPRAHGALERFGAPLAELSAADLAAEGIVFQIGIPPNRIDVLTSIDGVPFAEAWPERLPTRYGDVEVPVLSRRHLVRNKRAPGRPQDALDADALERWPRP